MAVFLSIASLLIYLAVVYFLLIKGTNGSSKGSNSGGTDVNNTQDNVEVNDIQIEFTKSPDDKTKEVLKQRLIETFRAIKHIEELPKKSGRVTGESFQKEGVTDMINEINKLDTDLETEVGDEGDPPNSNKKEDVEWITNTEIDF